MKSFMIVLLYMYYWGDYIKDDEMVGACSTHKREWKSTRFSVGLLKEIDHPKYLRVNGHVVGKWIVKTRNALVKHMIVTADRLL
jgi:hypothetical protein